VAAAAVQQCLLFNLCDKVSPGCLFHLLIHKPHNQLKIWFCTRYFTHAHWCAALPCYKVNPGRGYHLPTQNNELNKIKPLLALAVSHILQTAALYNLCDKVNPGRGCGDGSSEGTEATIKSTWWRQVRLGGETILQ
jgi:hypothetical protein